MNRVRLGGNGQVSCLAVGGPATMLLLFGWFMVGVQVPVWYGAVGWVIAASHNMEPVHYAGHAVRSGHPLTHSGLVIPLSVRRCHNPSFGWLYRSGFTSGEPSPGTIGLTVIIQPRRGSINGGGP